MGSIPLGSCTCRETQRLLVKCSALEWDKSRGHPLLVSCRPFMGSLTEQTTRWFNEGSRQRDDKLTNTVTSRLRRQGMRKETPKRIFTEAFWNGGRQQKYQKHPTKPVTSKNKIRKAQDELSLAQAVWKNKGVAVQRAGQEMVTEARKGNESY